MLEPRLKNDLEHFSAWAGKLHGAILRICGLLHCATCTEAGLNISTTKVSEQTFTNAERIGYYLLENAKAVYGKMGSDKELENAKYIINKIKRYCLQMKGKVLVVLEETKEIVFTISKRDIYRFCRGKFKSPDEIEKPLSLLCDWNYLKEYDGEYLGKGQKPSKQYGINRELLTEWMK